MTPTVYLGKWIYRGAKHNISEQNSTVIWITVDLPTEYIFTTVRKELPVKSLHSPNVTHCLTGIACQDWVFLFSCTGWTTLTMSQKVSWLIRKSLFQCWSMFWSFSMLANQSSSLWSGLNIIFLSVDRLSGRSDIMPEKVNFRPDIRQLFYWKTQDINYLCSS